MEDVEMKIGEITLELKEVLEAKSQETSELKLKIEELEKKAIALGESDEALAPKLEELEASLKDIEKKLYRTGAPLMENSDLTDRLGLMEKALKELNPTSPRVRFANHLDLDTKFHNTLNGPDGGFLVVPEFVNRILQNVTQISPVRKLASVMTVSSPTVIIPKLTTKLTAYNVGEAESLTESQMKFGQVTINLRQIGAQAIFTRQVIRDSAIDLLGLLSAKATEAFAYKEGVDFISGSGVNAPEGLLTASGTGTVTSATSGTVVIDDIMNMFKTIPHGYNPALLMNKNTLIKLFQQKSSGSGEFLINTNGAEGLNFQIGNVAATICGVPVYIMPALADVAVSSKSVILADLAQGYQVVVNGGMEILRDDLTQGANGMVVFNMFSAVGGAVVLPEAIVVLTTHA